MLSLGSCEMNLKLFLAYIWREVNEMTLHLIFNVRSRPMVTAVYSASY